MRGVLDQHGLEISSLAYYPNNLHPDSGERRAANTHLRKVIDAAAKLDVGIVGTFVGRDKTKNVPDNFREFRKVWPRLVDYAEARGVKIAIENCPMIFSWDEWPGGTNLASYAGDLGRDVLDRGQPELRRSTSIRRTSSGSRSTTSASCGTTPPKLFHVHAKDMEIDRDGLYRNGTVSLGMGWQVPRLPGLGEVRWDRFIAALYRAGYDYVVSIEHEDRAFEATRGAREARLSPASLHADATRAVCCGLRRLRKLPEADLSERVLDGRTFLGPASDEVHGRRLVDVPHVAEPRLRQAHAESTRRDDRHRERSDDRAPTTSGSGEARADQRSHASAA